MSLSSQFVHLYASEMIHMVLVSFNFRSQYTSILCLTVPQICIDYEDDGLFRCQRWIVSQMSRAALYSVR